MKVKKKKFQRSPAKYLLEVQVGAGWRRVSDHPSYAAALAEAITRKAGGDKAKYQVRLEVTGEP